MILTGQNFTAESKVVFTEKTTGQRPLEIFGVPLVPYKSHHLFVPSSIDFGGTSHCVEFPVLPFVLTMTSLPGLQGF